MRALTFATASLIAVGGAGCGPSTDPPKEAAPAHAVLDVVVENQSGTPSTNWRIRVMYLLERIGLPETAPYLEAAPDPDHVGPFHLGRLGLGSSRLSVVLPCPKDGVVRLAEVDAARHVRINLEDGEESVMLSTVFPPGRRVEVRFVVVPADVPAVFRGVVRVASGDPAANAVIYRKTTFFADRTTGFGVDWLKLPSSDSESAEHTIEIVADDEGRFEFREAPSRLRRLIVRQPGHVPVALTIGASGWSEKELAVTLSEGRSAQVEIVDVDGNRVQAEGAEVVVDGLGFFAGLRPNKSRDAGEVYFGDCFFPGADARTDLITLRRARDDDGTPGRFLIPDLPLSDLRIDVWVGGRRFSIAHPGGAVDNVSLVVPPHGRARVKVNQSCVYLDSSWRVVAESDGPDGIARIAADLCDREKKCDCLRFPALAPGKWRFRLERRTGDVKAGWTRWKDGVEALVAANTEIEMTVPIE